MAFKYAIGQPFVYPKNDLDYSANFLRMCFSVPCEDYKVNAVLARALDRIFIPGGDRNVRALCGQRARHGETESLACAADHRHLVGETKIHRPLS